MILATEGFAKLPITLQNPPVGGLFYAAFFIRRLVLSFATTGSCTGFAFNKHIAIAAPYTNMDGTVTPMANHEGKIKPARL